MGIHKKSGKNVAVKIVNKTNMTTQDVELIKSEIEILKLCQHPNIIRLLDYFENSENIFIIMELLQGGDLFLILKPEALKFQKPEQAAFCIH